MTQRIGEFARTFLQAHEPEEAAAAPARAARSSARKPQRVDSTTVRAASAVPAPQSRASVREVQQSLVAQHYRLPKYGVDGRFGNETAAALRQFQADRGLPLTGRADAATVAALKVVSPAAGTKAVVF